MRRVLEAVVRATMCKLIKKLLNRKHEQTEITEIVYNYYT